MKRTILIITALLGIVAAASAQPRAVGGRIGASGLDAVYQHSVNTSQFIEANVGLDFGYGAPGFKVTGIYNFVWARPAWTDMGSWACYAGPGISLGGVEDRVPVTVGNIKGSYADFGFMCALTAQVGLEYTFDFPLALAVDISPYIGMHATGGRRHYSEAGVDVAVDYEGHTGFYNWGLFGFIPSISARYRF